MDLPIRPRLGLCIAVLCGVVVCCSPTFAQIAGTNVNMVSGTQWPGGDPFLQRQNEPSIAVSSRNPFHLLAGSNDYRSVDLALTTNGETGDAWLGLFKSLDGGATWRSILLPGCPYNTPVCAGAPDVKEAGYQAAADPTVRAGTNGMFYYAGLVFNRGFNPHSAIIVSRLIDLNNKENADPNDILNGDAIQYIGTSIVATGTSSLFLDKPSMAVDIPRPGASTCNLSVNQPGNGEVNQSFPAGNVFVAYTAFNEPPNTDPATVTTPQESTIYFVRSTNCGASWSQPIALNIGDTVNQSVVLAINPNNGYIYAAWRQFHHQSSTMNQPDAIIVTHSTNGGLSFAPPVQVSTFAPFDEGTTTTSFRTNAYPNMVVDASGRVYIAYSARNAVPSGDARIVLTTSTNGLTWTLPVPIDNPPIDPISNPFGRGHQIMPALTFAAGKLSILYYDLRLDHTYGLFSPQFLQGQPTGIYTQMPVPAGELGLNPPLVSSVFNQYIDDSTITLRRHTFDLRLEQALPAQVPVFAPSILVSQYAYGCCASSQTDIEQLEFNAPNLPLFRSGTAPFMGDYLDLAPGPSFLPPTSPRAGDGIDSDSDDWHYNLKSSTPTTLHAAWTDNRDVQAPADGNWTHYTPPNSPSLGSTSIFQPGTSTPVCQIGFTGSRNQNIYTAPISNGLVFGAPANTKQLGTTVFNGNTVLFQRAFAVVAQNTTTNLVKSFRLTIANQPVGGSASFLQFAQLTTLDLSIPALSSATRPVFVTSTNPTASVTVNIAEITAPLGTLVPGGLTSFTTLNPDITNPAITNPAITNPAITNPAITNFEVYNPAITNPAITNPAITNPAITNPAITNPAITNSSFQSTSVVNPAITNPAITNPAITNASIANPAITNPAITNVTPNESITDTQWTLSNTGNTEGSFTLNLASSSPVPLNNVLQLIISRLYQTPAAPSGQSCNLETETHNVVVTNIVNPVLLSPTDPAITNPAITNPAITNPTVALAPGETANIIIRVVNPDTTANPTFNAAASVAPVAVAQAVNTQTALSVPPGGTPPPPPVTAPPLQITTTSLPNTVIGSLYAAAIQTAGGNLTSHTFSIISGALPAGLTLGQTAGTISGTVAASSGTFSFVVQAQDVASGAFPQHTATQNLSITVTASGPLITSVSPTPLLAPATPHVPFAGNFVISGQNLQGATVTTDGPLLLTGAAVVNATGTSISQGYSIGCCVPQQGQVFHLFVNTAAGSATLIDTVALTSQVPGSVSFVSQPSNSVGGQTLSGSPVVVQVTDKSGAAIAGMDVTMSFNGTPPCAAAALSGTLSQVTTATGQAIFPDLSIDRGQLGYTLLATAGNVGAVSNPFTVNGFCATKGPIDIPRQNHTATTLFDGRVLVAGGGSRNAGVSSPGLPFNSAVVYDRATGNFTATGSMNVPRWGHTATRLLDGRVLIAGGVNSASTAVGTVTNTAEIFDPTTNTFTPTVGVMSSVRFLHTATLLADGRVLLAGGGVSVPAACILCFNFSITNAAEIFDPLTGLFTPTLNPMAAARLEFTATLLPNGQVLIAGGFAGVGGVLSSAELYDPVTNGFLSTGSMTAARNFQAAQLLPSGKVLLAGGATNTNSSADLYDPTTGTFAATGNLTLATAAAFSAIPLPDGTVLLPGGKVAVGTGPNAYTSQAETYNPAGGTFATTGSLISPAIFYALAPLSDGSVLTTGGENSSGTILDAEIYYSTAPSAPIAITTASLANAATGAPYTQILLEQGGLGNLTWTESGTLPTGITFTNQGVLSGTPTVGGSFPLIITVTDSSTPAKTVSANFTLTVTNLALVFTSSTVPTAVAGKPYSQPIPVVGGTQPYNATVTSGTLPPGLLLTTNGVLNGTPSGTGTFSFTVTVTDSSSPPKTATQTLTMSVNTLVITTTVLPNGIVGVPYSAAINTAGGTLPLSFSLANTTFPPGLTILQPAPASSSGALAGTPTLAGTYSFSESVVDSSSPAQTAKQNYVVTIAPVGTPAPAKVAFVSQPQNSIGGQTLSGSPVVVSVADSANAPISGVTVAMSFNGAPPCGAATLSGALTAVTDAKGNATFSNLSIDRGQFGYTLLASAGSASAVSSPFNVQGFCNSANLSTQREFHTQVLLGTGKVLIAGGVDNLNNAVNTAELYDPATGTTSPTGNPCATAHQNACLSDPNGRVAHISVLLPNGTVLLAGGQDNISNALTTAELYDPATGTFSPTGSMMHARFFAEAVLLADGRVLVAGGNITNTGLNTAEIYDPATGLWTPTGNMTQGRIRHRMTLLPNGKVLVTGGRDAAVNFFGLSSAELFDPFANQGVGAFTAIGNMNSVRFVHGQSLLSNGTVLVAGGFDNTFASVTSAEIFDPATNLFTLTGNMNIARSRHSSTLLPDGSVLETGGINTINGFTPPAPAELYLPAGGSFALTGSMTTGRELAGATLLPNGNVLVSGGDDAVNVLNTTEVYYNTAPIAPIQITATTVPNAFVGQPYVATALEQNGTGLIIWSTISGSLPPGLKGSTIGTYGVVSGTPITAGSFTFTAQVTDGRSVATRSFTINVSVATLAFTSNTMPTGGVGRAYSQPLPVTGGTQPYTATVTSGTLPPGLALSSNGVLSGTPSSVGPFTFTVNVTDSSSPVQSATQTLTIAVDTLFITTTALPGGMVGVPYNAVISTTGGTLPLTFSAATAAFPPGLAIQQPAANSHNGALAGTPTTAGHFTFVESVADSSTLAQTATQYYTMDIFPVGTTAVPASAVFLSQPQNSVGGQILTGSPIRVRVFDATNTPIFGVSVAMSFNGAPPCSTAVLSGTLTAVTNGNGVAVFPDLSIDRGQLGYTLLANAGSVSAVSQPFTVNGFCPTGNLNVARRLGTATLLPNGKVLIAGGFTTGGTILSSAELYDPSTGLFTSTGSMSVAREFHTATLLPNGKVLVTGGIGSNGLSSLSSAELYDPAAGAFTPTGTMSVARDGHTATLLTTGKVLIAAGESSNGGPALSSAELYDPASGVFAPTGNLTAVREQHTATLLPNGTVLLAGGTDDNGNILATAEVYSPSAGTFAATGSMGTPRILHVATLLPSGKVLVAGGATSFNTATLTLGNLTPTAELYDPISGLFSFTGSLSAPDAAPGAAVLPDGNVLVTNGNTTLNITGNSAVVYNSANSTFTVTGSMPTDEIENTIVLLNNGTVLDTGGSFSPVGMLYYSTAPLAPLQVTTPTTAPAGTTAFTTPASFATATFGATTTGFNGIIPAGATFAGFSPLVVNGITFSTPLSTSGVNINVTKASFYTPNVYPADFITNSVIPATGQPSANNTLTITLPAPTRAFAMDFGGLGFRGASSATITLSNGFVLPLSSLPTVGNTQFRGFVSTTPFNTITFSTVNDDFVVQDVLVANADITLPGAVIGAPYTQMLLEQGGVGVVTWTLASGTLPLGITLSANGVLQGTPTAGGTFTFTVNVVDSSTPAKTTSATFILNVNAPAPVITGVTPTPLPAPTTAGVSFTGTFVISGQNFQGAFVTTDGPLLLTGSATVNANGTSISQGYLIGCCAPQQGQVFHLIVNTPGSSASVADTIALSPPLAITTTSLPNGTVGMPYAFGISSSGGLQPVSFAVTNGTFPAGLTLASNGGITGTPTTANTFTFTITATDGSTPPQTASHSYTVTIAAPVQVPATVTFVTQPQNSIEGQVLVGSPVNVLVMDATGKPIPNINVSLSLATKGCAGVGGTAPMQATDATGTASFTNLIIDHGGFGYSIAATAGNVSATSNSFNVEGFCDTGSVGTARVFHSSVALPNGLVLIAGGASSYTASLNSALSSAELYNPATHSFTAVGNMNTPRNSFTMTLLSNGRVLVAGGYSGSAQLSSAELFDPSTNTFTLLTNSMTVARYLHAATLLPNGKVLITGGGAPTSALGTAELFDPSSNTFTATTGAMTTPRSLHHADLLANGHVLLTGGVNGNFVPTASAELYDPASDKFTATGSMATAREQQATALLFNGTVLVAGGDTGPNNTSATATAEIYDPAAGTFTATGNANFPIAGFDSSVPVLPDGRAFLADPATNAQVYDPAAGTFSTTGNMTAFQGQPQVTILPDGTALVAGGVDSNGNAVANAEIFYPIALPSSITITLTALPQGNQNQPYTQQLLEKGGVGTLTWILASGSNPLPTGLTLSTGGLLSGTPTQFGSFVFTVQVTDSSTPAKTAAMTYTLVVSPQFQFVGTQLQTAFSGVAYSAGLPLIGGTTPYTSTLTAGILPAGLTFANGTISGTTTAVGTYSLTFQATDSSTPPSTVTATLTLGVTTPLAIITTTLPNGNIGSSYSAIISTTGGLPPILIAPTANNLPPGLTMNPQSGVLSGTPTTAGTFTFTLTAVDQSLPTQTATQTYTVIISSAPAPISLSPNPLNLMANNTGTMTATVSAAPGGNGLTVNLVSSNPGVAGVPPSVLIGPTSTSVQFQVTAGGSAGNATITASATGATSGTATVVVTTRPMSLTTDGLFLAINRSFNATVTLAQPVPTGSSVSVTLTASPLTLVSISPATQTIAAGQTTAVFVLSAGSAPGSLVLTATASGYTTATAPLTVTANLISFGTVPVLAPGQSGSLPVSLSFAAPPGGLTINFSSANTAIATITPSVFVPAGLVVPAANPQVTGVAIGSTTVTATATGFAQDIANVSVTVTATFSPNPFGVPATRTNNITLVISAPAPQPNGITFNLTVDNTAVATVPSSVTIPAGQLSASVPVTGVAQGTANLSAAFPGITTAVASINVVAAPALTINLGPAANLGQNLQVDSLSISLTAAAAANELLTLNSNSANVLLANTPAGPFSQSITLALSQGSFSVPTFSIQGLANSGSATLTAAANGYSNATATVNLTASGFVWGNGNGAILNTTTFSPDTTLTVVSVQLDANLNWQSSQNVRTGFTVNVTVTSSNTAVGTLVTSPLVFTSDTIVQNTNFHPLTAGSTTLVISTPPNFATPSNTSAFTESLTANVTAPSLGINLGIAANLGQNLQVDNLSIGLGAAPPTNRNLTLSSNSANVLLANTPAGPFSQSITLALSQGSFSVPTFSIQGLANNGSATLTASTNGYSNATATVNLTASGFVWGNGNGAILNTTTFSPDTTLFVGSEQLDANLNYQSSQNVRTGLTVNVTVTSSNTAVGTLLTSPLVFTGDTQGQSTNFHPLTAGTTTLAINTPPNFATPSNTSAFTGSLTANVTAPTLAINLGIAANLGQNLQVDGLSVSLGAAPPNNEILTLSSSSPNVLLAASPAGPFSQSVSLQLTKGSFSVPTFSVQGLANTGSAQLVAKAPGYIDATSAVNLTASGFVWGNGNGAILNTTTFSPDTTLFVGSEQLDANLNYQSSQNVRTGLTVNVTVTSSNTAVGTLLTSPLVFTGDTQGQSTNFHPLTAGTTTLAINTPPNFATPSNTSAFTGSLTANVTAPTIAINTVPNLGQNLQVDNQSISLAAAPPSNGTLTLTTNSPNVLLATGPAGPFSQSIGLPLTQGSFSVPTFSVQGLAASGGARISASAPGYTGANAQVTLTPSAFVWNAANFATTTTSPNTPLFLAVAQLDPATVTVQSFQALRSGMSVSVTLSSSVPSVGTIASPVLFTGDSTSAMTSFQPLAIGSTSLVISTPATFTAPNPTSATSITATVN